MESPGQDVVLSDFPEPCIGVFDFSVAAYPSNSTNQALAIYFGNKSIYTPYYLAFPEEFADKQYSPRFK